MSNHFLLMDIGGRWLFVQDGKRNGAQPQPSKMKRISKSFVHLFFQDPNTLLLSTLELDRVISSDLSWSILQLFY